VKVERIGVVGAGTMGAGIAQVACLGGFRTLLHDPVPEALAAGEERFRMDLLKGADRGRWPRERAEAASARLLTVPRLDDLAGCELAIEAAPEDLALKRELFARLATACGPDAILATNTSSLSVSELAASVEGPERVCGMHFFNPPALMPLVEIVRGERTSEVTLEAAGDVARAMGRDPVRCSDSVGFIVNRCNRPFTLEALALLDEGIAGHDEIDHAVRERGGYRMGPFELMDLVGIDVNLEVARSFYRQRPEPRWRPSPIQERMVSEGRLGRKAGRGFYDYAEGRGAGGPAQPPDTGAAVAGDAQLERLGPAAADFVGDVPGLVVNRIVCQLVNEGYFALEEGVGEAEDIDRAMRLGLNHPRGPFEWADEIGQERVLALLEGLARELDPERYAAAPALRDAARSRW
jgi:3-hydroxybutyryl-CoA dehydrogenase